MTFKDRKDAGQKLAKGLENYRDGDVIVLAIPRGGTELGYEVAKHLNARFSLLVTRKLPLPHNPEAGFGAIAEDGSKVLVERTAKNVPEKKKEEIIQEQKKEVERRVERLRGEALPDLRGETVILVDDGIAMGSTMRASIKMCRNQGAGKIIAAVPVSSPGVAEEIQKKVDELLVLERPRLFRAVAQAYENWHDVQDEEVIETMERWKNSRS